MSVCFVCFVGFFSLFFFLGGGGGRLMSSPVCVPIQKLQSAGFFLPMHPHVHKTNPYI